MRRASSWLLWSTRPSSRWYRRLCATTSFPDHIRGPLGDHDHRRVDVAADEIRHHRGIDDAEVLDLAYVQALVNNSIRLTVLTHAAGSGWVMDGDRRAADEG